MSTAKLNGSGYQEACLCKCLFRWDVIKSVLDEKENLYFILLSKLGESYHSLLPLNFLAWNRLWSCHIQECVQLRSGLVYVCTISKWSSPKHYNYLRQNHPCYWCRQWLWCYQTLFWCVYDPFIYEGSFLIRKTLLLIPVNLYGCFGQPSPDSLW